MQIPADILAVLTDSRTVIQGDRVQVPFQIDDALYRRMNVILKDIGGKWDGRKAVRAHTFPYPVEAFMREAVATGQFPSRTDQGWFPTPGPVIQQMFDIASVRAGMTVLEPSAGAGAIADRAALMGCLVDCVEIDQRRAHLLDEHGSARHVTRGDFLQVSPLDYTQGFDRVLMNPPFSQGLAHIMHAIGFLGDDAILVAVMSEGIKWWSDRASQQFRELVKRADGEIENLPAGSFAASGTDVRTVMVVLPTFPGAKRVLPDHSWHCQQPVQLGLFG